MSVINLISRQKSPKGIWSDGTTVWVGDDDEHRLFAYTLSNGNRDVSKEFDLSSSNLNSRGIWSDGTTMWVIEDGPGQAQDSGAHKLFAYTLSNGNRNTSKEFDLYIPTDSPVDIDDGNYSPTDLWSNGTTMWVSNAAYHFQTGGRPRDRFYAYTLSNGNRDTSKEFNTAEAKLAPWGIWGINNRNEGINKQK